LVEYCAKRHFPETLDAENPASAFLDAVIDKQADLIAKWQLLGFIHGVMNTDNMLICGETVDYGPCAFMDAFDPNAVFSSIDRQGRYAYSNQPKIAHWNLSWLAQALMPLMHLDKEQATSIAQKSIDRFPEKYHQAYNDGMALKLGFERASAETAALADRLFDLMAEESIDFTLCYCKLADDEVFVFPSSFDSWVQDWKKLLDDNEPDQSARLARMRSANPVYIPRNHLVEEAIESAQNSNDFSPFHVLVDLLANPYTYDESKIRYATPPKASERVYQTFCGT
ncbi:UNVERIFIED_CONTAM: hypothetical protein GTU68_001609, partial [Idotea baltica]|nr:hypothetical protein [Idotea baltica]